MLISAELHFLYKHHSSPVPQDVQLFGGQLRASVPLPNLV